MMYPMDDIWLKGHLACARDRMQIVEAFNIVCGRIIRMLLCCLQKRSPLDGHTSIIIPGQKHLDLDHKSS